MNSSLPSACDTDPRRPVADRAFTLIELLVATAVLVVVLTLMVQVVQYASRAARHGQETSEVFSSARGVLDTMGRDIENAVIRDDLAAFAGTNTNQGGSLAFYSRVPGLTTNTATDIRRVSLISYHHDTNNLNLTNLPMLSRSDLSVTWSQTNRITFGETNSLSELSDTAVQSRNLCEGVLGFDVRYVHQDGTASRTPSTNSPVRAVKVTIALVDPEATRLLARATLNGVNLNKKFVDLFEANRPPDGNTNSAKTAWTTALKNPDVWTNVPEAAKRRMKVYQRFYTLPHA